MILDELTFGDIGEYLKTKKTILIPIGSTEWHSKALPLATDTLIAENIAKEVSKRKKWLVGPTVNIGYSDKPQPFMKFAGTISYTPATLNLVIIDYISSLQRHGFRSFYIINAHGGNDKFIKAAAKKLKKGFPKCKIFLYSWWKNGEVKKFCTDIDRNAIRHAGTIETALALYLFPNKVRKKFFNSEQTSTTKDMGKRTFGLIVKNILEEINAKKNKL